MRKLVFLDSGVLIAAARCLDAIARRALAILSDPDLDFASSVFVRLEVLPKPLHHKKLAEAEFYQAFFGSVSVWAKPTGELIDAAYDEAVRTGLSAMDAIHVVSAATVGASELHTSEKPGRPIHRTKLIRVCSIHP